MSRAFVKEDANNLPEELPERQVSVLPNYVTPQGRAGLESRLAELIEARKSLISGKSDDPLQGQQLRLLERDLRYYEARLKSAILVNNSGPGTGEVRFGARVTVKDSAGTTQEFSIVGEDEADAASGKISWASPLASALLGARPGASVSLVRGSIETKLEITAVRYSN
ncbi:MAG: hypothetical protein A2270_01630 [Elusimicrobia bacterium RIFOXYA12_FULL_51_18]|nr:MAG: hypothetical protein A2270_01630 [Elusimicrobia bacterium RIFOXYA12_FULL_51_18]OGS29597.1 MAG: hypothetical protein A2218_01165 [Elusimicrobia bacterium RIFOXYA2_FULL_53_38]